MLSVLHYLPELAQTHVHWVSDPTVLSSVTPLSSCPRSFPEWGSFPVSRLFESDGWRIGASASVSVLPVNFQGWFPLGPKQHQIMCDSHFCPSRAQRTWGPQRTPDTMSHSGQGRGRERWTIPTHIRAQASLISSVLALLRCSLLSQPHCLQCSNNFLSGG